MLDGTSEGDVKYMRWCQETLVLSTEKQMACVSKTTRTGPCYQSAERVEDEVPSQLGPVDRRHIGRTACTMIGRTRNLLKHAHRYWSYIQSQRIPTILLAIYKVGK